MPIQNLKGRESVRIKQFYHLTTALVDFRLLLCIQNLWTLWEKTLLKMQRIFGNVSNFWRKNQKASDMKFTYDRKAIIEDAQLVEVEVDGGYLF